MTAIDDVPEAEGNSTPTRPSPSDEYELKIDAQVEKFPGVKTRAHIPRRVTGIRPFDEAVASEAGVVSLALS